MWILLIALTACNSAETGRNSIDPTLATLVPPDATMLAGLRIDAIRATPLYQKMLARKQIDRLDEFAHQTGRFAMRSLPAPWSTKQVTFNEGRKPT